MADNSIKSRPALGERSINRRYSDPMTTMTFPRVRLFTLAAWLLCLVCGLPAQSSDSAEALLRAAIDKEVVDGDLRTAIKQYQAIVDGFGKIDRASAATALLRMADAYQRLGDTQSRKAVRAARAGVQRPEGDGVDRERPTQRHESSPRVPSPSGRARRSASSAAATCRGTGDGCPTRTGPQAISCFATS